MLSEYIPCLDEPNLSSKFMGRCTQNWLACFLLACCGSLNVGFRGWAEALWISEELSCADEGLRNSGTCVNKMRRTRTSVYLIQTSWNLDSSAAAFEGIRTNKRFIYRLF